MWNKVTKFIPENFRIVATLVTFSIITFINEGSGGSFSMNKFTDSGFAGFSLENALKGTLMTYLYLFEGLSILGVLIVIMWRVIAGYWIWNMKDHTKMSENKAKKSLQKTILRHSITL
ncbi:MAG: hypothetical protein IPL87_01090 [Candidatus Moraniibacteriota bacterium]|nr:MAG: hypothetical protein IPL87_01090 [Candidatus Moranbacteria bacterium]